MMDSYDCDKVRVYYVINKPIAKHGKMKAMMKRNSFGDFPILYWRNKDGQFRLGLLNIFDPKIDDLLRYANFKYFELKFREKI